MKKKKTEEPKKNKYRMYLKIPSGQTSILKEMLEQKGISLSDSKYIDSKSTLSIGSTDTNTRKEIRDTLKKLESNTIKKPKDQRKDYSKKNKSKSQKPPKGFNF